MNPWPMSGESVSLIDKYGPWGIIACVMLLSLNWVFKTLTDRLERIVSAVSASTDAHLQTLDSVKDSLNQVRIALESDKEVRREFELKTIAIIDKFANKMQ